MDIKVLYTRGDGIYVVQKDNYFYLVNLQLKTKSPKKEYVESFLKFGYFEEVKTVDGKTLNDIKLLLDKE